MQQNINYLIDTYTEELTKWAMYKIPDTETAKDLVQDTFLAVLKNINSFNHESNPKTWIFSILNHKIADYYRKKYREPQQPELSDFSNFFTDSGEWQSERMPHEWQNNDLHLLDDEEFRRILSNCIENLPEKWNALVNLKYILDESAETICQELNISPTNMWQIMHRAKLNLRTCIENNWFKK